MQLLKIKINEKANNDYYQSAFSEKALMYSESENSDQLFTDVENYRTTKNDSIQKNYGPWGDYKDSVVINIHSYHHDGFGPDGDIQIGCGITAMDMEVLTRGGMVTIIIGQDHSPFYGGMYDPFNPFGDIMTHSIMVMDMVMDMHMVIIRGGGHITLGTITTHMEETLIQMFHL